MHMAGVEIRADGFFDVFLFIGISNIRQRAHISMSALLHITFTF